MAIIQGYTPAQQPQLTQPWQLPFNEMYTALKDKQSIADAEAAKSDELMITLGNITNLLEPDLYIHKNKMSNVLAKEQELRSQVGDDLTRPEYRQGLRKLVLETATDPFYSAAMGNYQKVHDEYYKDRRTLELAGAYTPSLDMFEPDLDAYKGAINPDGTVNILDYEGLSRVDQFLPKVQELAKEIRTQKWGTFSPQTQPDGSVVYVTESGETLTKDDIVDTLWNNMEGLTRDPDFVKYKKRWLYDNKNSLEGTSKETQDAAFSQHMDDVIAGFAEVYDVNDYEKAPTPYLNSGSGSKDKALDIKTFTTLRSTVGSDSSGFATPEAAKEFIDYNYGLISEGGALDINKKNVEASLGVTIEPVFTPGLQVGNPADPSTFSKNVDRFTFTIKDMEGNIIDENSPKYKENYQEFKNLQYKYEQAYTSIDRVGEFDAYAKAASGYDPSKTSFSAFDIDAKAEEIYQETVKGHPLLLTFIASTGGFDKMPENLKKLDNNLKKSAKERAEQELFKNDPQYDKYQEYKKLYEQAYSDGTYPVTQYSNSFGWDEDAKKFTTSLHNQLINKLSESINNKDYRGVAAYNIYNNDELEADDYNDLAEDIKTKLETGQIEHSALSWRLDDGGDGLVVDLTYNGKVMEFREVGGIEEYLATNGYQDFTFLTMLNKASSSMKPSMGRDASGVEGAGRANDFGFMGGQAPGFPRDMFKRTTAKTMYAGEEYPIGSFIYEGKLYRTLYDVGVAYLQKHGALQSQSSISYE